MSKMQDRKGEAAPRWKILAEGLYRGHRDDVYRLVRRLGVEDPEGVVHDAFIEMTRYLQDNEVPDDPPAMLFTMARRRAAKDRRFRNRRPEEHMEVDVPTSAPNPEEQIHLLQRGKMLDTMISMLPADEQALVLEADLDEESRSDIAASSSTNPSTVRSKLRRTHAALAALGRRYFKKDLED